jgi:hypothetical protein
MLVVSPWLYCCLRPQIELTRMYLMWTGVHDTSLQSLTRGNDQTHRSVLDCAVSKCLATHHPFTFAVIGRVQCCPIYFEHHCVYPDWPRSRSKTPLLPDLENYGSHRRATVQHTTRLEVIGSTSRKALAMLSFSSSSAKSRLLIVIWRATDPVTCRWTQ